MKPDEINKALDKLDKFDFFNQRAGRELWNDKPLNIQNKDIEDYTKDIQFLKSFFYSQQAKIEALKMDNEQLQSDIVNANGNCEKILKDCELLKTALAQKIVSEIKSEAIKEFAERLKSELAYFVANVPDMREVVDNLVKKMVGENNDISRG